MSTIIKSFVEKEPQNTYNSFFFFACYIRILRCGKIQLQIRLEKERNIRINTLLSYYSLREPRVNPKGVYTCDRTVCCYHFIYWRLDLHYSVFNEWKNVDTPLGSNVWSPFRPLLIRTYTRNFSIRVACSTLMEIEMNSPIYVPNFTWKITSVCVTDTAFLVCYVRNMTYHENKKIRCIAVEIISRFFFPATSKKLWLCFQCGKRYMWKDSLKKHLRVECGKEPTYECPICGRKFKHKHRWQSHARLIHYLDIWPTKQALV